jgi:hypothetical protein
MDAGDGSRVWRGVGEVTLSPIQSKEGLCERMGWRWGVVCCEGRRKVVLWGIVDGLRPGEMTYLGG